MVVFDRVNAKHTHSYASSGRTRNIDDVFRNVLRMTALCHVTFPKTGALNAFFMAFDSLPENRPMFVLRFQHARNGKSR